MKGSKMKIPYSVELNGKQYLVNKYISRENGHKAQVLIILETDYYDEPKIRQLYRWVIISYCKNVKWKNFDIKRNKENIYDGACFKELEQDNKLFDAYLKKTKKAQQRQKPKKT
jgi:hypothetical protein